MSIAELFHALIPLYVFVILGIFLGRVSNIRPAQLAELLIFLLSPAVIFTGAYTADLSFALWSLPVISFSICCLLISCGLFLARRLFPQGDGTARIASLSIATGNTGYFGIPAVIAILGPEALPIVVMVSFGFTLFESTVGYYVLQRHQNSPKQALFRVFRLPIVYAFTLGVTLNMAQVNLPDVTFPILDMMRTSFTVLGMMLVGLALSGVKLSHFDTSFHLFVHIGKFIVGPSIMVSLVILEQAYMGALSATMGQVLVILALTPMAANIAAFAAMFHMRPQTASLAVMVSTLLALVILPFGLSILLPLIVQ